MKEVRNIGYNAAETTAYDEYNSYTTTTSAIPANTETYVYINQNGISDITTDEAGRYSVFDIANWFLLKEEMTQKKLQKLCYYAQAWCYALKGYRLITAYPLIDKPTSREEFLDAFNVAMQFYEQKDA